MFEREKLLTALYHKENYFVHRPIRSLHQSAYKISFAELYIIIIISIKFIFLFLITFYSF